MVPVASLYIAEVGNFHLNQKFLSGDKQSERYGKAPFAERQLNH
jgi:hypothetical protein